MHAMELALQGYNDPQPHLLARVREHLAECQDDAAVCLVCLETIASAEAVWYCRGGCYVMTHLGCAQSWARQQLDAADAKTIHSLGQIERDPGQAPPTWACPKCRHEYAASAIPRDYSCFCGKVAEPAADPWLLAHSCGGTCGRPLPGCGHPCALLCHPGPCPPCPRMLLASCHCGAASEQRRCHSAAFACGAVCGRQRGCGHACSQPCHAGPCPPCTASSILPCRCGAQVFKNVQCWERGTRSCSKTCGKPLGCGAHTCALVCHAGPCPACPLAGRQTCPCGKTAGRAGAGCGEEVPPCGATCGKSLPCGQHTCEERCHAGPCPSACRAWVDGTCACGKTSRRTRCGEEVRCDRRCAAMRACGRHACRRRCCSGDCPPCEEVCGRRLRCGSHRCAAPCHAGPCRPCQMRVPLTCACGHSAHTVPCGAQRAAAPPACRQPCAVPAPCRHAGGDPAQRAQHACHYGPCPPCPLPCGTRLPCGHLCASEACHDAAPTAVAEYAAPRPPPAGGAAAASGSADRSVDRSGPVSAAAEATERAVRDGQAMTPCPPCMHPVAAPCLGGHEVRQLPCSASGPYACGAPCDKPLACGRHACALACHAGPCTPCTRRCGVARGACAHACPLACHPDACPVCVELVQQACHCGKSTLSIACAQLTGQESRPDRDLRSCGAVCLRTLPLCPHLCREPCHGGPCPGSGTCQELVTVRCACKATKQRMPCVEARALLARSGREPRVEDGVALRLLPCSAACRAKPGPARPEAAAAKGPAPPDEASGIPAAAGGPAAPKPRTGLLQRAAGEGGAVDDGKKIGHRVARPAGPSHPPAPSARELRLRQQRQRVLVRAGLLVAVVLLVVGLALCLTRLLAGADAWARRAWGQPGAA
uniref:NF-X1-type domain-containing protein n=1 Tax=Auxenochlorella protothecoides TaxID=3075 RepID=A0A1D2AHD6_AUXPR